MKVVADPTTLTPPLSKTFSSTSRRLGPLYKLVDRVRSITADDEDPIAALETALRRLEKLLHKRDVSQALHDFVRSLEAKIDSKWTKISFLKSSVRITSPRVQRSAQLRHRAPPTIQDFEIIKGIGKGAFGRVYLVSKKQTGDIYALKVLRKDDIIKRRTRKPNS
jgi:hypothetical protein